MFRLYLEFGRLASPDRDNGKMVSDALWNLSLGLTDRTSSSPVNGKRTRCRLCMTTDHRAVFSAQRAHILGHMHFIHERLHAAYEEPGCGWSRRILYLDGSCVEVYVVLTYVCPVHR